MPVLSTTAAVVGLTATALHGIRRLTDDIRSIIDAPKAIKALESDLSTLASCLESLRSVEGAQWEMLGATVAETSQHAIERCSKACDSMHADLQRWTRRTREGKLSWRDRTNIGFFKERRVKAMAEQLQSAKLTFNSVVAVATFYTTLNTNRPPEAITAELAAEQTQLARIAEQQDNEVAAAEQALAELRIAESEHQSEQDEEDLDAASVAVEEEAASAQSCQDIMRELLSLMQTEKVQQAMSSKQAQSIKVTFGDNNSGFQMGTNSGTISGISFRRV